METSRAQGPVLVTRVVGLLVVLVILAGAAFAFRERWWPASAAPTRAPAATRSGDPVGQALAIAADTTRRNEWVDAVPGIDDAHLGPVARKSFIRLANAERCTCGCGFTLAACRAFDPSCEVSLPIVRTLLDSLATAAAAGALRR